MKFAGVRLLVKDYKKCFKFYTEKLGFEPLWGDNESGYASFKVADGIEGFAIFVSDDMAPAWDIVKNQWYLLRWKTWRMLIGRFY